MARKKKEELVVIDDKERNILLDEKIDKEEIVNELKEYVDERVNDVFFDELEKANKKLVREKSKRIFWKNVIIVLLLAIIGFLLYILYSNNYFDRFFNRETNIEDKKEKEEIDKKEETKVEDNKKEESKENKEEKKEPTFEELKKEYESLLDNYYVTENSSYLNDFYSGELTNELMKYMTLNTFDFSSFSKEEDYNIIKESTFKIMYEKLFDEKYVSGTFNYGENKVRYIKQMESYMTESVLVRDENNIKREIKDIKKDGEKIIITTIEGVVKDNKLYNVISNDYVANYDESLVKYEDKLNKITYTFINKKLISISK